MPNIQKLLDWSYLRCWWAAVVMCWLWWPASSEFSRTERHHCIPTGNICNAPIIAYIIQYSSSDNDNLEMFLLFSYLRVNKVPLVVVEAPFAEVTVGQSFLQKVSSIELMPRVFDLEWKSRYYLLSEQHERITIKRRYCELTSTGSTSTARPSRFFLTVVTSSLAR